TCKAGACVVATPASTCDAAGENVITGDQRERCAPYVCKAGRCLTECASNLDCTSTTACGLDGRCEPITAPAAPEELGACSAGPRGGAPPHRGLAAAAIALGLLLRRASRSGRITTSRGSGRP